MSKCLRRTHIEVVLSVLNHIKMKGLIQMIVLAVLNQVENPYNTVPHSLTCTVDTEFLTNMTHSQLSVKLDLYPKQRMFLVNLIPVWVQRSPSREN